MAEFIPPAKPIIGDEERAAVDRVLRSGMVAQGPEVKAFEEEFGRVLVEGWDCVAVNSGTSGQHLGLLASGIGPGDEVIVPAFTFAATGNAVALTGATPVFADIDLDTYTLDPDDVRAKVTERTRGIMPVHLYGHPAPMDRLQEIADEYGLEIYEDAAQAHGARLHGRRVGTFGAWAMFSLYPTKNMTSGEGGMVSVKDPELGRRMRMLRNQGMKVQYQNELVGLNNRMTDIHAAIGRVQLTKVLDWTERRRQIAARFDAELRGVAVPVVAEGAEHVYHQYTVRLPETLAGARDAIRDRLKDEFGVGTGVYYPVPTNELPSFRIEADLPNTRTAAATVFSLPVHPSLTDEDVARVVEAVNTVVEEAAA
ncbi:DegT/DnrJ/EryC1/StrS family aminotransferase [Micrococcus flavus]|uniref:dTDP-4-amino-4,6-dideoxygalactose transaminase n=1 Tax=Micrococcus flavus TaxID=384602 RepID=A0A4Y8X4H0_9MICC|nr:DegT/DnrJ/EryC1/StrS family aminotransferase [Micrococcus flavus]MBB4882952.1 dTDP-4-amino-4,6-dideoxygalactose transaminase [Micrococcus flavus]TFI04377.1 DegT/DnrJ/EryC1/StrS family aminotransferase [Micrococcus flavus]GGK41252.1 aminotransferase DegT [Micrococcus flavus]